MSAHTDQVDALSRAVLQKVSPDEVAHLELVTSSFHATRRRQRRSDKVDPLAFGIEAAVTALAPIVVMICAKVLEGLAEEYTDRTARRALTWIKRRRRPDDAVAGPFSAEALENVEEEARRSALASGVDDETASVIAKSLIAELRGANQTGDER
ncbi:hypothetical protein ACFV9G_00045 [Nocardioides sp. NPDC059952]|uniref:hypothetical protein n=1 Tax=Nocardioides sp. NPDC059952 TaxID=3347014 RepID=UPI003660ED21